MVSDVIVFPCKNFFFVSFYNLLFKGSLFVAPLRYDVVAILQDCMVKTPEFL